MEDKAYSSSDEKWLKRAKAAYQSSTEYVDANLRKQWEEDLAHFNSEHAPGSKYHLDSYKYRSKIFRPKSRATIRGLEAASVAAFFSNQDVVNCEPANSENELQEISAEIVQQLLQYRLTQTLPWYQTVIGGVQDATSVGFVCSYQNWEYQERTVKQPVVVDGMQIIDEEGNPLEEEVVEVLKDQPIVQLKPVENIRIHPAADWNDPLNTSAYLIDMLPMMVQDVKARMEKADPKTGEPKWKSCSDDCFSRAKVHDGDSTRMQREKREDKYDEETQEISDFDIVWVHRNFIRIDGDDYVYYTLGCEHLLSTPKPKAELYPHLDKDERPYTGGCAVIETHKIYPGGVLRMGSQVQKEINENANQRADNVKFVMNKRWFAKRGRNIDVQSLLRNVPGSVTLLDDVNDVRGENFADVTSSAYAEQDRLNVDFDEVTGAFSTGSIQTNRKLGETVGGMSMLRGSSNLQTEYVLRTIAETWLEPTLKQLVKLEQYYENDMTVLNFAAEKAQLFQRYGTAQITDEMLRQDLTVTVNVGMGATDPVQRLEKFLMAMGQYIQIAGAAAQLGPYAPELGEVRKEIFGRLGYKDGDRFFAGDEMQAVHQQYEQAIQQLQQQNQQLMMQLKDKSQSEQAKMMLEAQKQENDKQIAQMQTASDIMSKEAEREMHQQDNVVNLRLKQMDLMNPVAGER